MPRLRLTTSVHFLAIAIVAVSSVHSAVAEAYDVFILAGQSNMDGRGNKADLVGPLAQWAKPQADVAIMYSDSTLRGPYATDAWQPLEPGYSVPSGTRETLADKYKLPGTTFGPEVSFGRTVAAGIKGRRIALIKFSEGGTSLKRKEDWNPEARGALYDQMMAFVRKSLKLLSDDGNQYEIAGFVWHQGESDNLLPDGEYEGLLTQFIARVRNDLHNPNLLFVIGEVNDNSTRDAVRAAQRAVARAIPNTVFVSAGGLETMDRSRTHFTAAAQIELGRRMADAVLKHLPKKRP